MIKRAIGRTNEPDKLDILRAIMKNRMYKKQKPSVLEKAQCTKVTSLLNTHVVVNKLTSRVLRKHFMEHKEHFMVKKV